MHALLLTIMLFASDAAPADACNPAEALCEVIDPATGQPRDWPDDVDAVEGDAFGCIHFGGEPYESAEDERGRYVIAQMKKHCGAVARALPGLKRKYRGDPAITARLANIEAWYGGPID